MNLFIISWALSSLITCIVFVSVEKKITLGEIVAFLFLGPFFLFMLFVAVLGNSLTLVIWRR